MDSILVMKQWTGFYTLEGLLGGLWEFAHTVCTLWVDLGIFTSLSLWEFCRGTKSVVDPRIAFQFSSDDVALLASDCDLLHALGWFAIKCEAHRLHRMLDQYNCFIISEAEHSVDEMTKYLYSAHFHLGFLSELKKSAKPAYVALMLLKYWLFNFGNSRAAWLGSSDTRVQCQMAFVEFKLTLH